MFKNKLYNIYEDIYRSCPSANDALDRCVSEKLDNTSDFYRNELRKTLDYLASRKALVILRDIFKEIKK